MTTETTTDDVPRGRAVVAARLASDYAGRVLCVGGCWYCWTGRRWAEDDRGEAVRAVIDVVEAIVADPSTTPDLRADVRRCGTVPGLPGLLSAAAALPPLAGTTADLAGPAPEPAWAPGDRWSMAHDMPPRTASTTTDRGEVRP